MFYFHGGSHNGRSFVVVIALLCLFTVTAFGQTPHYGLYRAIGNGNFDNRFIWEVCTSDTTPIKWEAAATDPGSSPVYIGSAFSVTFNATITSSSIENHGTITINPGVTVYAHQSIINGTINGPGCFDVVTSSEMYASTVGADGYVYVSPGANLVMDVNPNGINGSIVNDGTTTCSSGQNGIGTFTNNGTFLSNGGSSFAASIINNATFNISTYSPTFSTFSNIAPGVVTIGSGLTMTIRSYSTPILESGTYNIPLNSELSVGNGSVNGTYNFSGTISGQGTAHFAGYVVNMGGTYNITGTTRVSSGTTTFSPSTTVTNIGNILADGGTLEFPSGLVINGMGKNLIAQYGTVNLNTGSGALFDSVTVFGGSVGGSDSISVTRAFIHKGGSINGTGPCTLLPTCVMTTSTNPFSLNKPMINNGIVYWTSNFFSGTGSFVNNGTMNINLGIYAYSFAPAFTNSATGVINKNGSGAVSFNGTFSNEGTITDSTGAFYLAQGAGTYSIGGTLNGLSGTTLYIGGSSTILTVNSTIATVGTVSTAGTLTYSLSSSYSAATTAITGGTTTFTNGMTVNSIGSIDANSSGSSTLTFPSGVTLHGTGKYIYAHNATVNFNTGAGCSFDSVNVYNGTIAGSDSLTVVKQFLCQGGSISGTGIMILAPTCTTNVTVNPFGISKRVENSGLIKMGQNFSGTGPVVNYGSITCNTPSCFFSPAFIDSSNGSVTVSGSGTLSFTGSIINTGWLNVTGGSITLAPTSASTPIGGIITGAVGTTIYLTGATFNGNLGTAGIVQTGGTVNLSGAYNCTGTTTVASGTTNFNSGMTIASIGDLNATGGYVNFLTANTINSINNVSVSSTNRIDFSTGNIVSIHNLTLAGSSHLLGSDSVRVSGVADIPGWLDGPGSINLISGSTGTIHGDPYISNKLFNYGTVTWTDNNIDHGGTIYNYGTLNVNSSSATSCNIAFINNGTINRITNNATTTFSTTFTNNGVLNISKGTVSLNNNASNSGTIDISPTATLSLASNSTLSGIIVDSTGGTISGAYQLNFNGTQLLNNGTISVSILRFGSTTTLSGSGVITSTDSIASTAHVTLGSDHRLSNLFIVSGGSFDVGSNKLSLSASGTPLVNNGTFSALSGTVNYNGTLAQSVATTNVSYGSLSVSNSAGVTLGSAKTIPGTLTLASGVFNNGANLTMGAGSTIVRTAGSLQSVPTFSGTVNLLYNGTSAVTTGAELPTASPTLSKLTVNDTAGVTLNVSVVVNDTLTMQQGLLSTGNHTITLNGASAFLTGEQSSSYVVGTITASRSVGTGGAVLAGLGVSIDAGINDIGTVTLTRISGSAGKILYPAGIGPNAGINRKWILSSDSIPTAGRTVHFNWVSADDNVKDLANAQLWQSVNGGTTWNPSGTIADVHTTRSLTLSTTTFGSFTVSDASTPLPVEITEFTAKAGILSTSLHWSTATENRSAYFELSRRSNESSAWSFIGKITAAGTSASAHQYNYNDKINFSGTYFYQLTEVDADGSRKIVGNVESVIAGPTSFTLNQNFPNPFNPSTTIRYGLPYGSTVSIKIYNNIGQQVADLVNGQQSAGWYEAVWNAHVASGVYYYRINAVNNSNPDQHFTQLKKMILMK